MAEVKVGVFARLGPASHAHRQVITGSPASAGGGLGDIRRSSRVCAGSRAQGIRTAPSGLAQ